MNQPNQRNNPVDLDWWKPVGGGGPGASYASRTQILLTSAFNILLALLVFYGLLALWPHPTPALVAPEEGQTDTVTLTRTDTAAAARGAGRPAPAGDTLAARADTPAVPARAAGTPTDTSRRGARPPASPAPRADTSAGAPSAGRRSARQLVPGYLWCDKELQQGWAAVYADEKPGAEHEKRDPKCVQMFGMAFPMSDEQRLLLLVLLAGALGGMIHVLRSIAWYVGNRELVRSWLPRYYLLPLTGAALGAVIYVLLRGGFFASNSSVADTSPFGFVAIAVLAGMFSEQFVLKLQELSETLLTKPKGGADPAPPQNPGRGRPAAPTLAITRDPGVGGAPSASFRVKASGIAFVPGCQVWIGMGTQPPIPQPFTLVSATELQFQLAALPAAGTVLKVEVSNPDGRTAAGELAV